MLALTSTGKQVTRSLVLLSTFATLPQSRQWAEACPYDAQRRAIARAAIAPTAAAARSAATRPGDGDDSLGGLVRAAA